MITETGTSATGGLSCGWERERAAGLLDTASTPLHQGGKALGMHQPEEQSVAAGYHLGLVVGAAHADSVRRPHPVR